MRCKDAYRAQIFLKQLLEEGRSLESEFEACNKIGINIEKQACQELIEQISLEVDLIATPTIIHEIYTAKEAGLLRGLSDKERYVSFFVDNHGWSNSIKNYLKKYEFITSAINNYITSCFVSVKKAIGRLCHDWYELNNKFELNNPKTITKLCFMSSDRHCGGQRLIVIEFENCQKIIYKPVDISVNNALKRIHDCMDFAEPYNLIFVDTLSKDGYGWLEYLDNNKCSNLEEIKKYYKRCGSLLLFSDYLNYCDGHLENLVAYGCHPVIIDCETFFHYFDPVDKDFGERSILFTGLIQKPTNIEDGMGFSSAFQSPSIGRCEFFTPVIVDDHTDQISLRYKSLSDKIGHNNPIHKNKYYSPKNYINEFIEGFEYAYNHIQKHKNIFNDTFWSIFSSLRTRQVIRHTMFYSVIIHKLTQATIVENQNNITNLVKKMLFTNDDNIDLVIDYELNSIINFDIPYFYHFCKNKNLYDGKGSCYTNFFAETSLQQIQENFRDRDLSYLNRSIKIIENVLPASP